MRSRFYSEQIKCWDPSGFRSQVVRSHKIIVEGESWIRMTSQHVNLLQNAMLTLHEIYDRSKAILIYILYVLFTKENKKKTKKGERKHHRAFGESWYLQ